MVIARTKTKRKTCGSQASEKEATTTQKNICCTDLTQCATETTKEIVSYMYQMQPRLSVQQQINRSHANAYWRKTIQMHHM